MPRKRPLAVVCSLLVVACGAGHFPRSLNDDAEQGAADAAVGIQVPDVPSAPVVTEPSDADAIDAEAGAAPLDEAGETGGACNVRLDAPPLAAGVHVQEGTAITYPSNPPSSGEHYPVWANFQEFNHPIDDGYLVHSMEHGAVVLLYKCADDASPACAQTVAALRALRDAVATDPACDPSIRVRIVIAPRPANDVAVAAAAWGYTYRANCVDAASLTTFINAHYGRGPEDLCFAGSTAL